MQKRWLGFLWDHKLKIIGVGATFSGAALLANILVNVSLPLALLVSGTVLVVIIVWAWWRASPLVRKTILRLSKAGFLAGLLALIAYDSSKWLLSRWDTSAYNPFEAIHIFGALLIGHAAPEAAIWATGIMFHITNGVFFGIAFAFIFEKPGVLKGIAWGVFLELFQLTLYPGWLSTEFYDEFVQISAIAHVVYGATLGGLVAVLAAVPLPDQNDTLPMGNGPRRD